jgi:hypothetical protein
METKRINKKGNRILKGIIAAACLQLSAFTPCTAQTALSSYQPGQGNDGIVYFLPKTAVRFNILIEKTTYTPGDYCKYAQRYLRMNDVALTPSTTHRILSIKKQTIGVADTTKAYQVKFNPKTVAPNMSLSPDGRLLAINAQAPA